MRIRIKDMTKELQTEVVRIDGAYDTNEGFNESIDVKFTHHKLFTEGDSVVITNELTHEWIKFDRTDFYTIELM